jgi:ascorbate PTS system EIIB component
MKSIKIMTLCSFGLGTSLVLKMTLDAVLEANGVTAETFCSDADTALGQSYDLVITSRELAGLFDGVSQPVVVIDNFLSLEEVQDKVMPVILDLIRD